MKKKILLVSICAVSALAMGIATFFSLDDSMSLASSESGPIQPGTLTIDYENPSIDLLTDGVSEFKTAAGNKIKIGHFGVTDVDGYYSLDGGYLYNVDPLNGITGIEIHTLESQQIVIGFSNVIEEGYLFKNKNLTTGDSTISMPKSNYVYFDGEASPITFTRIVFYFECVAGQSDIQIYTIYTNKIGDYTFEFRTIGAYALVGESLANLDLSNYLFYYGDDYVSGEGASDVEIEYLEETEATTVLPGVYNVSISFTKFGFRFYCSHLYLRGYTDYNFTLNGFSLHHSDIHIQDNDDLPDDFILSKYGSFVVKAYDQIMIDEQYFSIIKPITEDMIAAIDEHPFTVIGTHFVKISDEGRTQNLEYHVYDPEYNNIKSIWSNGTFEVPYKTSNEEFLKMVKDTLFNVSYFEDDYSLPYEISLPSESFILKENHFYQKSTSVVVDIHYENYEGQILVPIHVEKGELINTLTSDEPVVLPFGNVASIKLYDNEVCEFIFEGSSHSDVLAFYTLSDNLLTTDIQGMPLKFDVDLENHKFTPHKESGEVLYEIMVDFSSLGAPENFPGKIYDNNVFTVVIYGTEMSFDFTYDEEDHSIIYFVFATYGQVKGVIDTENLIMVVTYR